MKFGDAIISKFGRKVGMVITTFNPPYVGRDKFGNAKKYVFEWVEMEQLPNGHWKPIRGIGEHLAGEKAESSYITLLGEFEHGNLMPRDEYSLKHGHMAIPVAKKTPHHSYVGPWGYDYKGQLTREEAEERRQELEEEKLKLHNTWRSNFEAFFGATADAVRSHLANS